jgi:phosphoenolpyruvate-protein phosphotransferase (PTS system enzyme I)
MTKRKKETQFQGNSICPGIAIGQPFLFSITEGQIPNFQILKEEVEVEVSRFKTAIAATKEDLQSLKNKLQGEGAKEGADILETHLTLMEDSILTTNVEEKIREKKKNAESIFYEIINKLESQFADLEDSYFQERFADVADVARRVLKHLKNSASFSLADIPKNSVVFAKELSPSDTAEADRDKVIAFVTDEGGRTSHAAIIAKSKGIPFITGVSFDLIRPLKTSLVVVDGKKGKVILNPDKETLSHYENLQQQIEEYLKSVRTLAPLPTETEDGYSLSLSANVEGFSEVNHVKNIDGCGIGLLRSEYLCKFIGAKFPSEEDQFEVYKKVVEALSPRPVVIRTFDVGGDKFAELVNGHEENNPFLGCRAIRFMLREKEVFKTQIRALLRASAFGSLKILLPMISSVQELLSAKEIINEVKEDLTENGLIFSDDVKLGCMIEVPSAALTCDLLAKECDFLSLGTNDLVQYSLAVDRGNESLDYLYNPLDPSIIRLLKLVVSEANNHGIPVSACGEIAADPLFVPLFLGLGVQNLSVAIRHIPIVKKAIRRTTIVGACELVEHVLSLSSAKEIKEALEDFLYKNLSGTLLEKERETLSLI